MTCAGLTRLLDGLTIEGIDIDMGEPEGHDKIRFNRKGDGPNDVVVYSPSNTARLTGVEGELDDLVGFPIVGVSVSSYTYEDDFGSFTVTEITVLDEANADSAERGVLFRWTDTVRGSFDVAVK